MRHKINHTEQLFNSGNGTMDYTNSTLEIRLLINHAEKTKYK